MSIICLFLPAVISVLIDFKLRRKDIEKEKLTFVAYYFMYVFLINVIINTIIWLFAENKFVIYDVAMFSYSFCVKYLWVVLPMAIVMPIIINSLIYKRNIQITFGASKNNNKKEQIKISKS